MWCITESEPRVRATVAEVAEKRLGTENLQKNIFSGIFKALSGKL